MTVSAQKTALELLKVRIDRAGNLRDEYLTARIEADVEGLASNGIHLTDSPADIMLLVDYSAWRYANRDKPDDMPRWLRLLRRERWLADERMREGSQ